MSVMGDHSHSDINGQFFGRTYIGGDAIYNIGPFKTKEACAKEVFGCYPDVNSCRVGKLRQYQPVIDADTIIDQLRDDASNEAGEVADDFLLHVSAEDKQQLTDDLTNVLGQWLILRETWPRFGSIEESEVVQRER